METLLGMLRGWLDPELFGPVLLSWGERLAGAIAILLIGRWIVAIVLRGVGRAFDRARVDPTLARFVSNLIRITLLVLVVLTALNALGVSTTNFIAIIGAAGLAVGLALKDSLANFSSGVMLVLFRPFKVGNFIEASGISGTVEEIGMFSTVLKTPDNRVITVPNGMIYGDTITNYSAEDTRRIDMTIGIAYDDDIPKAKSLIEGVLAGDERVLEEPQPAILLMSLGASSVDFAVRPWVKTSDYWSVRSDLLERIKVELESHGLSIPFPQHDVHLIGKAANST